MSTCSSNTYYEASNNTCPACNPVCSTCTSYTPTTCTSCAKTPGGQQLYLDKNECVIECRLPYDENEDNNKCERSTFEVVTVPVLVLLTLIVIAVPLAIISQIVSVKKGGKAKIMDELYAYVQAIMLVARIFLVGNLWAAAEVFTFALTFMNIACTGILSVLFYFTYLEPIFVHSPSFKTMRSKYKKTFTAIIILSWGIGVNFVRLLFCGVFGTKSTRSDLHTHYFFIKPLNNIANMTLIFNAIDIVSGIITIFSFTVGNDAWALAVFTMCGNCVLCLFQLVKNIQLKKMLPQYRAIN